MKGSLRRRGENWSVVFDFGRVTDPVAGFTTRKQKTLTLPGSLDRPDAEAQMRKLLSEVDAGTFAEPSKITLAEFLRSWLEKSVKPPMKRPNTYRAYGSVVEHIATAPIGAIPLQKVRSLDLEGYLGALTCATSTRGLHRACLHRALSRAVKAKLLPVNPANDLELSQSLDQNQDVLLHCWSAAEARTFLDNVKATEDAQTIAFLFLALDTGARKSELFGLGWEFLDLDTANVTFNRQLDSAGLSPTFGPLKGQKLGRPRKTRTMSLGPQTVEALRRHKATQAAVKMANRLTYCDFNLVFAKEVRDCMTSRSQFGQPLDTLSEARFQRCIMAAGVRRIKFHGTRHTVASLLLGAGEPPHVVAARLGHSTQMLLSTYAHCLPDQGQKAAAALAGLLHG